MFALRTVQLLEYGYYSHLGRQLATGTIP